MFTKTTTQKRKKIIHANLIKSHLLKVEVLCQLHVLGVNPEDLHPAHSIRDANVNLAIKASKATEGRVNGVGPGK